MDDRQTLGVAFMGSRPKAAARVLADMNADDAAVFLDSVPTRVAATVFTHMHGWAAAERLARMEPTRAAAIVRRIAYADALSVVRLMDAGTREALLIELPGRLAGDLRRSLSFPADTVGAHMTMATLTLPQTDTVADARSAVQAAGHIEADVVFVVDGGRQLVGAVAVVSLLRYPTKTPLQDIVELGVEALPARARVDGVLDLDLWNDNSMLPVVNRRRQVVGGLTRRVARSLCAPDAAMSPTHQPGLSADLAAMLCDVVAGLADIDDPTASRNPTVDATP